MILARVARDAVTRTIFIEARVSGSNGGLMTDNPTKTDLILEGLQMGMEANAASMILINARIQMIADHIGLDVSMPPLTEAEEKNKDHMLKSVAQRVGNLVNMAAEIEGHPAPSPEETVQVLEKMKNEVWPKGQAARESVVDQFPTTDPFEGSIFEGAEPVDPAEVNMLLDDSTVEEDTELMRQAQAAEEPLFKDLPPEDGTMLEFKTVRPVVKPDPKNEFTVHVWELDGFSDVDFSDPESRQVGWNTVVQFYCDAAQVAVEENWLSPPWADRLSQEFMLSPEHPEITSSLTLPDPSDVTAGVAQTAADGDSAIVIKGITEESQVVEALMTAFMVTAARFNMNIGQTLLDARMAQLGLQA